MKEKFAKLISVKSIVTLALTAVCVTLCLTKVISGEQFIQIYGIIIAFYFGTQVSKKDSSEAVTTNTNQTQTAVVAENATTTTDEAYDDDIDI